MDVHAGIFWDPREPLPPGVEAAIHGARVFGAYHWDEAGDVQEDRCYQRRPHGLQRPQQQPGPHGGWDREEDAIPEPQRNNLPQLSVSVIARVVQDTAKVTVTQHFWNNTNESIWKGAYMFPLPAGCTVTSFSCRFGRNKIMKAKVKSKPKAFDAFNEDLRANRSAGLFEQGTPEIFKTTLGNIPANTKLRTEITYVTLLKHKFADNCNTTTLTIPTNIAPRYGKPPPELQNTPIPGLSHGISIQVDVEAEETAHKISSKSHRITVERGIGRNLYDNWAEFATTDGANDVEILLVKLEDGRAFLDRDFVLDIAREQQNGLETPTASLETHPTLANHRALMLTIPPKFMLRNQSSNPDGEIIFLADRSGSMSDKMESLKSAMNFFLKGIPQGRRFNIWCFGTHYTSLWPQSVDYSEEALQVAMAYVSGQFNSNMGGTEPLGALKAIVGGRNQGLRMVDIVMLTDGEVWQLDETVSFVQDTSRSSEGRIRYFALGIGNAVSHELVEGIAKAGGGYAEVIPAASQGGWEARVVAMLGAALAGHVGHFQIEFDGQGEDHAWGVHLRDGNRGQAAIGPTRPCILQSPADISTLSPFLRNRAFMLFDSAREQPPLNHINIKVTAPGGEEIITRVPISLVERKDSTLHKLGARSLLSDLERGQSWIHLDPNAPPRGSTQEQELVRQEGEAVGCKWSLVSKWTSFYAVEEPYHPAENARIPFLDPFLDAEDIQIREAVGDLDLLRPRGAAAQQANLPAVPLPAAFAAVEADDGLEDDEDTASNSDHMDMGSEGGGDSDSDDGGNDGDGGGAGGNQTGGSAGDQQGPEPGDSNADGDVGATGGNPDTQNDAPPPEGAGHIITYDSPCAPPLLRASGAAKRKRSGSLSTRAPRFGMASSLPTASLRREIPLPISRVDSPSLSRDRSHGETYSSGESGVLDDLNWVLDDLNWGVSHSDRTSSRRTTEYRDSEIPSSLRYGHHRESSRAARTSSPTHGQTPQSQSPDYSAPLLSHSQSDYAPYSQSPHHSYAPHSHQPSTPSVPTLNFSAPLSAPRSDDYPENRWGHSIPIITTPSFNMPASTAMRPNESRTSRTQQEIAGEQKIRNLLTFQSFDGSFNFDSEEQLTTRLGPDFALAVRDLRVQVGFKLAATVGLILLLEEKFEYCRDLWTLVYNKATDYFKSQRPLAFQRNVLLESTRPKVRALSMSQILQQAAPSQLVGWPSSHERVSAQSWSSPTERSDDVKTEPGIGRLNAGSLQESGAVVGNEGSTNRVVLDTAPIED